MKIPRYILPILLLAGCYSNNCPVNNIVSCNYYFYDMEGTPITYGDHITVSAIRPGSHQVYVYRKLGEQTITSNTPRPDLVDNGFSESTQQQRNDTILINKAANKQYLQVPMSYFNKVDTLLLRYGAILLPDTIYVEHESYPHVDIPECGSYRYHTIKDARATGNAIDHIEIANPTVNYDQNENIKIYFNQVAD